MRATLRAPELDGEAETVATAARHASQPIATTQRRIAFLLTDLNGGGVQKMALALAEGLAERGHLVTIVLYATHGVLKSHIPPGVVLHQLTGGSLVASRVTPLLADPSAFLRLILPVMVAFKPPAGLRHLLPLARFLKQQRPDVIVSGAPNCNLAAIWANRLAGRPTKVVITEHTAPSMMLTKSRLSLRMQYLPALMHHTYPQADVIVAVSRALANDLATVADLPPRRIITIYNPVVGPALAERAGEPVDHPWFAAGEPPVILSVGRLSPQKDYPTLVRAFAHLRAAREARLVILGEATKDRNTEARQSDLMVLAESLGVGQDVALLGFMPNPYAFMAKAAVFALSSAWEGFGNVLVEAMSCGCPVVSTDCPYGPGEILDGGRYGSLVPVGDARALADELHRVLASPPEPALLRRRSEDFTVARSVDGYLEALFGTG